MKRKIAIVAFLVLCLGAYADAQNVREIANPSIDMTAFLRLAQEAAVHRQTRRLTEDEFIEMSKGPGVIVLDARSREKFDELHVKGAVNLSFPDMTLESLARLLPDKKATILIYCNNNFLNEERAFPTKLAPASLNISTYIALFTYGYRNVYELGPLLDAKTTKLELVASKKY